MASTPGVESSKERASGDQEAVPSTASRGRGGRALTLLHAADLHIGHHAHPDAVLSAFKSMLEISRSIAADAILVAGDLFDSAAVPSWVVEYVFESFEGAGRPVVILPGNHDTLLTKRDSPFHGLVTPNVRVLQGDAGETLSPADGLTVWGRPVYEHIPEFHPLAGMPRRPEDGWFVAMGHGLVSDGTQFRFRGSPILHSELAAADCDYIALGHVHTYRNVTCGAAVAYYSGASVNGNASTAAIVRLDPGAGVTVQPVAIPYVATRD